MGHCCTENPQYHKGKQLIITITLKVFRREPERLTIKDTVELHVDESKLPKTFASDVEGITKDALASIEKIVKGVK